MYKHHKESNDTADLHRRIQEEHDVNKQEIHDSRTTALGPLAVSSPDDPSEQQADSIAKQVVSGDGLLSQMVAGSKDQLRSASQPSLPLNISSGIGQPLDNSIRNEMESKMGSDFSDVKIHTGQEAAEISRGINADAFTYGKNVYFGDNKFNAQSLQGKELLAHELVHTKQGDGEIRRKKIKEGDPPSSTTMTEKDISLRDLAKALKVDVWTLAKWNPGLSTNTRRKIKAGTDIIYPTNLKDGPINLGLRRGENEATEEQKKPSRDADIISHDVTGVKIDTPRQVVTSTPFTSKEVTPAVKDVDKTFKERAITADNLPPHAYPWGAAIINQLENRITNYESALHIFNEQLLTKGSKDSEKFPWAGMAIGMASKVLFGPVGSFLVQYFMDQLLSSNTPTPNTQAPTNEVDVLEIGKIILETAKENAVGWTEDRAKSKHNTFFADSIKAIAGFKGLLNNADSANQQAVDDRYQQLRKENPSNPTPAINYINELTKIRIQLEEQLTTSYSVDKFVEALAFQWISFNNRPTKKRNKPRTGYLQIKLHDPLEGPNGAGPPEKWKVQDVEIHAPYPGDIMELLTTYGSEFEFEEEVKSSKEKKGVKMEKVKKKGIDLATAPVPRRYLFITKGGQRIKGWSEGPLSIYELQSGFVGKAKDDYLERTLTTENLEKSLVDEKFPLDEVKTSEDMDLLKMF